MRKKTFWIKAESNDSVDDGDDSRSLRMRGDKVEWSRWMWDDFDVIEMSWIDEIG